PPRRAAVPGRRHGCPQGDEGGPGRAGPRLRRRGGRVMTQEPLDGLKLAADVQARKLSAGDLVKEALARAERFQDKFRAFIKLTTDLARKQAERVDGRVRAGDKLPLAGVPFAVKDLFDVRDTPTTCGSKAFADQVARADATAVARLTEAGAVLVGKL